VERWQVCRPTVINVYEGKMDTVEEWWDQWKAFMFSTPVTIKVGGLPSQPSRAANPSRPPPHRRLLLRC
jgi:hypothetical protein